MRIYDSQRMALASFLTGGIYGLVISIAYALTEYLFTSLLPGSVQPYYSFWHWAFNTALFVLYPLLGILCGGLCGLLAHQLVKWPRLAHKADRVTLILIMSTELLVMILALNAIPGSADKSDYATVFAGLFLLAATPAIFPTLLRQKHLLDSTNIILLALALTGVIAFILLDPGHRSPAVPLLVGTTLLALSFLFTRLLAERLIAGSRWKAAFIPIGLLALVSALDLLHIHSPAEWPAGTHTNMPPSRQPNVILVVLDTVRADHLSAYGYTRDTTPNLVEFSRDATLYELPISPGDMTLSAHGSIFTSLYANTHGAHYNDASIGQPLDGSFTTIAEALSSGGYQTVGIVSNHVFFDKGFGLKQGFDYMDVRPTDEYLMLHSVGYANPLFIRKTLHRMLSARAPAAMTERHYRDAGTITSEALRFLDNPHRTDKPFFLFLNYMDTHWPYMPPTGFDTLYPGKDENFTSADYYRLNTQVTKNTTRDITEQERNHLLSQYDGALRYIDTSLQAIFDKLRENNLYDDALIIITSDHGEAFGERQLIQHAVSAYQNQLHVPLLIRFPYGQYKGKVSQQVSLVSIMPTILTVAGIPLPGILQGTSLATDSPAPSRWVVGESFPNTSFLGERFDRTERAIFSQPYKLISSTKGKRELFNLELDPDETNNLYSSNADVARQLEIALEEWLQQTASDASRIADQEMSEATQQRLRALGYIE